MTTFIRSLTATFILLTLLGSFWIQPVRAQSPCGDNYVVLPGDTLSGIANKCGVTEQAIIALNPDIYENNQLFVGQVLKIPDPTIAIPPELAISPTCGVPGTLVSLLGSGFPEGAAVQISAGQKGQSTIVLGNILADDFGRIQTTIQVPSSAVPNKSWLFFAESLTGIPVIKGISTEFWITSFPPNPNAATTYIVQPGDTLRSIATKFNRSLEAILDANPQLSSSTSLTSGQRINIPAQEENYPTTTVLPVCGPAGNTIRASGSGFPPSTIANLEIGEYLGSRVPAGTVYINTTRTFATNLILPLTAETGEQWIVAASTSGSQFVRSISNIYSVTPPFDPNASQIYIVKAGDTMNEIAVRTQRTVNAILTANPQISNPNQLNVNDTLLIPRLDPTIIITPLSGPAFTVVQVLGVAFPVNTNVEISVSKKGTTPLFVEIVTTNQIGNFSSQAIIPGTAKVGEKWVILTRYALPTGTLITRMSSDFTIVSPQPTLVPALTIWPTSGPPGVDLYVVAYNFPPLTQVSIDLVNESAAPLALFTTWSDINGSFAAVIEIPESAQSGETWTVSAKVTNSPGTSATSELFTVSSP